MSKLAVIRIIGEVGVPHGVKHTLDLLNLTRKHSCVVLDDTTQIRGMLQKVKDMVTWGEVSDDSLKLLEKRRKDKVAHLHPPRGGFERKGTKKTFKTGGALGPRGEQINELIKKMS